MLGRFKFGKGDDADKNSTSGIAQKLFGGIMPRLGNAQSDPRKQSSASNSNASTPDLPHEASSSASDNLKLVLNAYTDPKPPLSDNPHYINRRFISFKVLSAKEQQALAEQLYPTTPGAHQLQINKALYSYSLTQILQALLTTWKTALDPKKFLQDIVLQAAPAELLDINVFNDNNEADDSDSEDDSEEAGESVKSSPGAKSTTGRPQTTEDLFAGINLNAISSAKDIPWLNLILCIGRDESRARVFISVIIKTVLATKFFKDNAENKQQHIASDERLTIKLKQLMISPVERLRNGSTVEELVLYGYSLEDIIDGLMECYDDELAFDIVCLRSTKLKNDFSIASELEDKIKLFISKAALNASCKLQHAGINFNDFRNYVVEHPEYRHLLCEQIVVASIFSLPLIEDSVVNAAFEKINSACHQLLMKDDAEHPSRESVRISLLRPAESVLDASALEGAVETLLLHGIEGKAIINCYVTSMKFWSMKKQEIETKRQEDLAIKMPVGASESAINLVVDGEFNDVSAFELIISGLIERIKPTALSKLESGFHQAYHSLNDQTFIQLEQLNIEVNAENAIALLGQAWPALTDSGNSLLIATKCLLKLFQHKVYDKIIMPLIQSDNEQLHECEDGDKTALLTNSKKLGLIVNFIGSVLHFSKHGQEDEFPLRLASIGVNTIDDLNALFGLLKNQMHFSEKDIEDMHALFGRWLLDAKGVDLVGEIISSRQVISGTMMASEESSNYSKALHGRVINAVDSRARDEQLLCDSTLYADTAVSTARLHHEFPKLASSENLLSYRALLNQLDDFICANQCELSEPLVAKTSWLRADSYHQALDESQKIIKQFIRDNGTDGKGGLRDSMIALPVKAVCVDLIKFLLFPYGNEGAFNAVDFSNITMDVFKHSQGDLAKRYSSLSARTQRILKLVVLAHNFKPMSARASIAAAPLLHSDHPTYIEPEVQSVRTVFSKVMDYEASIVFATDCIAQLHGYVSLFESSFVSYKKYNDASNFHKLMDSKLRLESNLSAIKLMSLDLIGKLETDISEFESQSDIDFSADIRHCKLTSLFIKVVYIKQVSQLLADLKALRFEEISSRRIKINVHQHSDVLEALCDTNDFSTQLKDVEMYISSVNELGSNAGSLSELAMLCIYMLIKPLMANGKVAFLQEISQSVEFMQLITSQTVLLLLKHDADGLDILQLLISSGVLLTDANAAVIDRGLSSSVKYYNLIKVGENKGTVKYVLAKIVILQLLYQHEELCISTDAKVKQMLGSGDQYYLQSLMASFAESFTDVQSKTYSNTYLNMMLASAPEVGELFTTVEYFFAKGDLNVIKHKPVQFERMFESFNAQCRAKFPLYSNEKLHNGAQVLSMSLNIFGANAHSANLLFEVLYRNATSLFIDRSLLSPKDDLISVLQASLYEVFTQGNPRQTESFVAQAKLDAFRSHQQFIVTRVQSIELFKSAVDKIGSKLTKIFNSAVEITLPHSITYKLVTLLDFFAMLDQELLLTPNGLSDEDGQDILLIDCLAKAVEDSRLQSKVLKKQTGKKNYEVIVTSLYANIVTNMQPFFREEEALINSRGQAATLNPREGLYILLAKKFGNENFTPILMRLEKFAMRKHNREALNGICDSLISLRVDSSEFKIIEKYFENIFEAELSLGDAEESLNNAIEENDEAKLNLSSAIEEGNETKISLCKENKESAQTEINLKQDRVAACKKALGTDKRIFKRLCERFDLVYKTTNMKIAVNNRRHSGVAGVTMYFDNLLHRETRPEAASADAAKINAAAKLDH
jgi:hypothetical protein